MLSCYLRQSMVQLFKWDLSDQRSSSLLGQQKSLLSFGDGNGALESSTTVAQLQGLMSFTFRVVLLCYTLVVTKSFLCSASLLLAQTSPDIFLWLLTSTKHFCPSESEWYHSLSLVVSSTIGLKVEKSWTSVPAQSGLLKVILSVIANR